MSITTLIAASLFALLGYLIGGAFAKIRYGKEIKGLEAHNKRLLTQNQSNNTQIHALKMQEKRSEGAVTRLDEAEKEVLDLQLQAQNYRNDIEGHKAQYQKLQNNYSIFQNQADHNKQLDESRIGALEAKLKETRVLAENI